MDRKRKVLPRLERKQLLNKYYKRTRHDNDILPLAHSSGPSTGQSPVVDNDSVMILHSASPSTSTESLMLATNIEQALLDYQYISSSEMSEDSVLQESGILFTEDPSQNFHFKTVLENQNDDHIGLNSKLSEWALRHNITHSAITDLLQILKPNSPTLPTNARTLLHTPRELTIHKVEPGKYYHFGFKDCLVKLLKFRECEFLNTKLEVFINIDGLPLSKSSGSQLYPILCKLTTNNIVGVIGLYHGYEKPKEANDFLKMFIEEAVEILTDGIIYNDTVYQVEIRGFVCDVPAKSFIKYTVGHTGYMSCSKCQVEGSFDRKICFPQIDNLILRTDAEFRSKIQGEHHKGTSILELLPNFDMVKQFPLDYMHLVCLGVVKKLIVNLWLNGKPPGKLSFLQINSISESLLAQVKNIPYEFNRKPRCLHETKRWKATEFRMFLFYIGPVVLKNNVKEDIYKHFISLHFSMSLLSVMKNPGDLEYARTLLKYFVKYFIVLYGSENVSHNVHNLLHTCDDVQYFGPLDSFSAFPFENHMQYFKKFVRKGERPLEQIVKRINEQDVSTLNNHQSKTFPVLAEEHFGGSTLGIVVKKQYKKLFFQQFMLSVAEPDNCCFIENEIILIKNIIVDKEDKILIIGQKFLKQSDFYGCPSSSDIGIYLVTDLSPLLSYHTDKISYKCMKLDFGDKNVTFPLLHLK